MKRDVSVISIYPLFENTDELEEITNKFALTQKGEKGDRMAGK